MQQPPPQTPQPPQAPTTGKFKNRVRHRDNAIRKRYSSTPTGASASQRTPPSSRHAAATDGSVRLSTAKPGTVAAMDFNRPILVSENTFIVEVARTMAGQRADAVLVTDAEGYGELKGIVTDKDLAFRCVAEGLEPSRSRVSEIMTRNPTFVSSAAPVDEAINLMLNGHFRHLPVVDSSKIVGIVDITKVLMHIQGKIQNSWGKARALTAAFAEFQNSWQNFTVSTPVEAWFKDWEEKMIEPSLSTVMDYNTPVVKVSLKTSVRDAARVMRDNRQTAVLVYDGTELSGIFTTKDICLRVLAPNDIDPKSTSVIRVMTPRPDCGQESMTVKEALKKMHDGHYLHIPVLNSSGDAVVGLVDVLFLTYHTMEQLLQQQLATPSVPASSAAAGMPTNSHNEHEKSGPLWSKFWEDAAESNDDPSAAYRGHGGGMVGATAMDGSMTYSAPSISGSQSATTVTPAIMDGTGFVFKFRDPLSGQVHRFTASVVPGAGDHGPLTRVLTALLEKCGCSTNVLAAETTMPFNDNDDSDDRTIYNGMKDTTATKAPSVTNGPMSLSQFYRHYHYLPARPLMSPIIAGSTDGSSIPDSLFFRIAYKDDDGDLIDLHSDAGLMDAVGMARMLGWARLVLRVEAFMRCAPDSGEPSSRMVPLVPCTGRDGSYMLSCYDESSSAVDDWASVRNGRNSVHDDVDSMEHPATAIPRYNSLDSGRKGPAADDQMKMSLWIGMAGLVVGAMGVGMMVASRFR